MARFRQLRQAVMIPWILAETLASVEAPAQPSATGSNTPPPEAVPSNEPPASGSKALSGAVSPTAEEGPTLERCVESHEAGQRALRADQLSVAEEQLALCASSHCPQLVARDCASWSKSLAKRWPTLNILLRAATTESAMVTLDGEPLKLEQGKLTMQLEPGAHTVELRHGDEVERHELEAKIGIKTDLVLNVSSARSEAGSIIDKPGKARESVVSVSASDGEEASDWLPPTLGGVALVGAGAAAFFGVQAYRLEAAGSEECAPFCEKRVSSQVRSLALWSDMGTAVAALSTLALGYLLLSGGDEDVEEAAGTKVSLGLGLNARRGPGAALFARGHF